MTPEMLLHLCSFTYFDLPEIYRARLARGEAVPLCEAVNALDRLRALGALNCGAYRDSAAGTFEALRNARLRIIAYDNDNAATGFVAYAFKEPGGGVIACVRGSETRGACVPTNIDWRDNFCAPVAGSVQYARAAAFADRWERGSLLLTGHSKGGNVALYAQSAAKNPLSRAAVFNAQGFARFELSSAQRRRMRAGAVNYVIAGDLTGALLYHPENRVFVRRAGGEDTHAPGAYVFNEQGFPIPESRTLFSYAAEVLSRALLALERLGVTNLTRRILRCRALT